MSQRIIICGDMHLGYKRQSFTTKEGRARYDKQLFEMPYTWMGGGKHEASCNGAAPPLRIQIGDLLDREVNSDDVLHQAAKMAKAFDIVLAGNHDLVNAKHRKTTLSMCKDLVDSCSIVLPKFEEAYFLCNKQEKTEGYESKLLVFVPYCYTQELFLKSLDLAAKEAQETEADHKYLMLHTNYDMQFEMNETTNNLTAEKAKELLKTFDYIFSGHEHNSSTHHKGRVIMTGSMFPVSMAETEDKYVWAIEPDGSVTKELVWAKQDHSVTYDISEVPPELPPETQFVEITGKATPQQMPELFKTISKWWKTSTSLLVCKPSVDVEVPESAQVLNKTTKFNLADQMKSMIPEGEVRECFEDLLAGVE